MNISCDIIATKTHPSYEFSSFQTGAGLRPKRCRAGVG